MPIITEMRPGREGRSLVCLDGQTTLDVSAGLVVSYGLHTGDEISPGQVTELRKADGLQKALQTAARYLGVRPRSEKELTTRLKRDGYSQEVIAKAMARMRELGLADDATFARFWKESRDSSRPRGRILMKQELRVKGVDKEVVDEAVADLNEPDGAYRAALKKSRSMKNLDEKAFYRRMGAFLQRRGYNYTLSRRTVTRVWNETHGEEMGDVE